MLLVLRRLLSMVIVAILVVMSSSVSGIVIASAFSTMSATAAMVVPLVPILTTLGRWRRSTVMVRCGRVTGSMGVMVRLPISTVHLSILGMVIRLHDWGGPSASTATISMSSPGPTAATTERAPRL
jgi:hypothetical protein